VVASAATAATAECLGVMHCMTPRPALAFPMYG
jgi:hypothetical protein